MVPIGCNCVVVLVPDVTCLHGFLFRNHRVAAIFFRGDLYLFRYIFIYPPGVGEVKFRGVPLSLEYGRVMLYFYTTGGGGINFIFDVCTVHNSVYISC